MKMNIEYYLILLAGTVFIEGLLYFQNKCFLDYACADSQMTVAVFNPQK